MMQWKKYFTLNRVLVALASIAVVLGAISYFVVFYGGGNYIVMSPLPTSTVGNQSSTGFFASSTAPGSASSTLGTASSTASSTAGSTGTAQNYASTYSTPPMTWNEGYDTIAITGASLAGSQLTLTVSVQMGAIAECVPMNLRLVTDEQGDLAAPLTTQFTFGENGTCIGTPGAAYPDQNIVFTVDPTSMPLSFTTGGTSNKYFELATTQDGGIVIDLPPTSG